ncbi:MAG: RNA polymerase sigma factor FliA [Epsilonproteobacteria bacterium]|nr:RNA polymerase sigma factor FliA [Campylobacterota bacterium]
MNPYEESIRAYQDALAVEHLPAVKSMAYKLKARLPSSVDAEELVAVATEELIKVSRRYDPKKNDNFWGYVKKRIQGSMLDYLRQIDVVSRGNRKIIKDVDKEIEAYYNKHNKEPDDEYLSQKLNLPIEKIKKARLAGEVYTVMPIEEQLQVFEDIDKKVEQEELIEIIKKELSKFSKREQLVIQLYYFEELSLKEISEVLGITESRISQIHKDVIRKIRKSLNG